MDTSAYSTARRADKDVIAPIAPKHKLRPVLRSLFGRLERWELSLISVVTQSMLRLSHLMTSFKGFLQCPRDSWPSMGAPTF
jgi:hypothetical protein